MKRRTFIAFTGLGCAAGSLSFLRASTFGEAPCPNDTNYRIAPRLLQRYDKEFAGKRIADPPPSGTNVLLITSDQHHYMCMGYNNPRLHTPNLDRLARMGIVFNRAYCNNPTSTPTRASIITGKYASQHGAWSLGTKLSEKELTVGDCFLKAGYRTALIGKAHFQPLEGTPDYPSCEAYPILQDLDFWRSYNGPYYGFEHVELTRNHTDEAHVGQHYAAWLESKGAKNWRDWFRKPTGNSEPQHHRWNIPEEFHYNTWITERAGAMLEEYKGKNENFFLWASYFDPHPSYLVPEPWASMYKPEDMELPEHVAGEFDDKPPHFGLTQRPRPDFSWLKEDGESRPHWVHGAGYQVQDREVRAKNMATYYGMISMLDHYIGKLLDKLEELDLMKSTAIVFTTDHGHFLGHHGLTAKAIHHYEDLIRIPWITAVPGALRKGVRSDALQSTVDLARSFLALAGIKQPECMSGKDQSRVWKGEAEQARGFAVVENHFQPTKFYAKTYVEDRYKITIYMNRPYGELFDLEADPTELTNLWDVPAQQELKAALLLKMLHALQAEEPLFMPRISVA
ncbi:MAG: sulfatase-like hydrolase/transferase [Tannerellaceae bacterium]|jgi:uncharacterized sulfatase|nr:sulfatase-like hydrolase/transferase [Tannerellaceae bacterium]